MTEHCVLDIGLRLSLVKPHSNRSILAAGFPSPLRSGLLTGITFLRKGKATKFNTKTSPKKKHLPVTGSGDGAIINTSRHRNLHNCEHLNSTRLGQNGRENKPDF